MTKTALDTPETPRAGARMCGCCGENKRNLAELFRTPGTYICRQCALWALRRADSAGGPCHNRG